ncbi:MAG TPA: NUDIX hydrolase [Candidatus Nanoarchaeia archaeon]
MAKEHGPWKIKDTVVKYKNPWVQVDEDQVIRPDGKPGAHVVVRMKPGLSVLPLDDKGYVYLTDEFHYGIGKNSVEVVSGGINTDEKPLDAAKREVAEELGIEAEEWISLGLVNPFTTVVVSPASLFLARKLSFKRSKQEGTETIKVVKVKFEEAVEMVMKSEITHGPSCVLILKARQYLIDELK